MLGRYARGEVPTGLVEAMERPEVLVGALPSVAGARSYLSDGRRVVWRIEAPDGWRVAVDAERVDERLPPHVLARSGLGEHASTSSALTAWTQAEVLAKLTDTPILLRLRRFGLGLADLGAHEPVMLVTHRLDDVLVTVGSRRGEHRP